MATEIDCPKEVRRELEIELRVRPESSRLSACAEYLKFYQLIKRDGKSYIVNSDGKSPVFETPKCDFQFVILRESQIQDHNDCLRLIISKGPHETIAKQAKSAVAAGDIMTVRDAIGNCEVVKITDQSGSYYIPNTDPQVFQKQHSARSAMKTVGLPMDKFQPFGTPSALVFSTTLRDMRNSKIKAVDQNQNTNLEISSKLEREILSF